MSHDPSAFQRPYGEPFDPRLAYGGEEPRVASGWDQQADWHKPAEANPNLYIHNVPRGATEEELKKLFGICGQVDRVRLKVNQKVGPHAVYAFITFATVAEAERALKDLQGVEMHGRRLRVEFQRSRDDCDDEPPLKRRKTRDDEAQDGCQPDDETRKEPERITIFLVDLVKKIKPHMFFSRPSEPVPQEIAPPAPSWQNPPPTWNGFLLRNDKKKLAACAYGIYGPLGQYLNQSVTQLNISHRSIWDDIAKKSILALCYFEPCGGPTELKMFADYIAYFQLKDRAGVVRLGGASPVLIYFLPPNIPQFLQFGGPNFPPALLSKPLVLLGVMAAASKTDPQPENC